VSQTARLLALAVPGFAWIGYLGASRVFQSYEAMYQAILQRGAQVPAHAPALTRADRGPAIAVGVAVAVIAGLVLAIALVLQFVANGRQFVAQRMSTDYPAWVGVGLLIAGATGIGSWFFGAPFLTSSYDYPLWPLVGAVPLASAAPAARPPPAAGTARTWPAPWPP